MLSLELELDDFINIDQDVSLGNVCQVVDREGEFIMNSDSVPPGEVHKVKIKH